MHIVKYLPVITLLSSSDAVTTKFCKRTPTSAQWPTQQQWQSLNNSVSGALRVPIAPGAVCHPTQPNFNNATCAAVFGNWSNTGWVAQNPWVVDYNDETCLPSALAPCSLDGYPAYVIEAESANDVAAGLRFAQTNQVRLIVKGTGHDFPGRSSGPGSLSIWTHKLQGIEVELGNPKAIEYGGVAAMKISAGMRWGEIYAEAAKHNLTVVGGADLDVGIGGWITGGGHSPISSKFGLGADQVLEMDVVTADGQILTLNETNNKDLFWAMRGGGGSTFAVLLSVTVKAYPPMPSSQYMFMYNTTSNSETFWSMVAHFHSDLPRLADAGGMGYYYILPLGEPATGLQGSIAGIWLFPQQSAEQVKATMGSFETMLKNTPPWASDQVIVTSMTTSAPDFTRMWLQNPPQSAGSTGRLGSWLLDGPALTANTTIIKIAFQKVYQLTAPFPPIGHLVSGPGTHNVTVPGGSSAVLPAWRKAYAHVVLPQIWTPLNMTQKSSMTRSLRSDIVPILKSLAPDSGAYMNEADPTNPTWKNDYFGVNYKQLLTVKRKWDPEGVFWCKACVGHDEWDVWGGPIQEDKENWGVAQVGGQICKRQ